MHTTQHILIISESRDVPLDFHPHLARATQQEAIVHTALTHRNHHFDSFYTIMNFMKLSHSSWQSKNIFFLKKEWTYMIL
jgi:hypothetical protein